MKKLRLFGYASGVAVVLGLVISINMSRKPRENPNVSLPIKADSLCIKNKTRQECLQAVKKTLAPSAAIAAILKNCESIPEPLPAELSFCTSLNGNLNCTFDLTGKCK